jgi:hypothetical protein
LEYALGNLRACAAGKLREFFQGLFGREPATGAPRAARFPIQPDQYGSFGRRLL